VSERDTGAGDGWLPLKLYAGVALAGAVAGAGAGLVVPAASTPALAARWAFYGGVLAATLGGFPVLFAGLSGLSSRPAGRQLVVTLYVVVVGVAAFTGLVLGIIGPTALRPPRFLGLVPFPPSPLGLALYGGLTLAAVLGAVLLLVAFVSRRYADPAATEAADRNGRE